MVMKIKLVFPLLIIISLLGIVNSATLEISEGSDKPVDISCNCNSASCDFFAKSGSSITLHDCNTYNGNIVPFFYYYPSSEDYALGSLYGEGSSDDYTYNGKLDRQKYGGPGREYNLSSKCEPGTLSLSNNILTIQNTFYDTSKTSYTEYFSKSWFPEDILEKYYYMKTEVKAVLQKCDGTNCNDVSGINPIFPNSAETTPTYSDFIRLAPDTNSIDFSNLPLNNQDFKRDYDEIYTQIVSDPGTYRWNIIATPIDLKCDFDSSDYLGYIGVNPEAVPNSTTTQPFDVFPDTDNDGWDDSGSSLGKGNDLCPGEKGTKDNLQGCKYTYSVDSCKGSYVRLDKDNAPNTHLVCDSNDWGKQFYFSSSSKNDGNRIKDDDNTDSGTLTYNPDKGNGFYSCYDGPLGEDGWIGYCKLRLNAKNVCFDESTGITLPANQNTWIYKYETILGSEVESSDYGQKITCEINSYGTDFEFKSLTTTPVDFNTYKYSSPTVLDGEEYETVKRDSDSNLVEEDDTTIGKISCDPETELCEIETELGGVQEINLSEIQTKYNQIKIIKNGINERNDTIDPKVIALKAHKIKKFKNKKEAVDFINKSYNLMTQFNITKNITYDSVSDKSTIKIKLENMPEGVKNITLYQVVSKTIADQFEDIQNVSSGDGEYIVLDKDPIIGWYFNESTGSEEISYEVPGENEGGTIIINQEAILYNEGELIVNYRENNCSDGEAHLFDLESLVSSRVFNPQENAGEIYKVCIAHETYNLENTQINNFIDLFTYENASNMSMTQTLSENVTVSIDNQTQMYWNMKIGFQNPDAGNYSCIGSFDDEDNSLFGDCDYNTQNRIWLHVGSDDYAPVTELNYPLLSHTTRFTLDATDDGGSGLNKTYYCIAEDDGCSSMIEYTPGEQIVTECPNDWTCRKTIKYYSTDNWGNVETLNEDVLSLPPIGNACQPDCTSRPSPGRYIDACNNINGCNYYDYDSTGQYDNGLEVSSLCHMLSPDTWINYNGTHEMQCPNGPFRPSSLTNENINIAGTDECKNLITISYPIIYNGEQINMKLVQCVK